VILDEKGVSHFSSLQQAFAKGGGKARDAVLYAFDSSAGAYHLESAGQNPTWRRLA
jgi:hypothetical protein